LRVCVKQNLSLGADAEILAGGSGTEPPATRGNGLRMLEVYGRSPQKLTIFEDLSAK